MQNDPNEQRYRRNLDGEYVTRHEWQMHLAESNRTYSRIETHLKSQDTEIDKLQGTISRAIGGATVVIVVAQTVIAYVISR